ncbi:hypothetical protein PVK06_025860 [Gossypium arboreum]|uniref:Transducin/WD40 repeat-like superfamily protein n=1 Tax=Gossypium arboreum TaxID=29729 RepID=A0ABR0NW58_GOSAR|nr:hypothetical protein PVK06_025860 [Gossypium arboreum]
MLRLRAFRGTNDKIVKIAVHPTHPWLVTADASDYVSVWNWEHRQIIYEFKAGGVDRRRLVGAKLEKLAEGDASKGKHAEAIRGGSVKQVSFFDDDVRYWQYWRNHSAAAEAPSDTNNFDSAFRPSSIRGQHYLVVCCENKAIFLDLVTMRGRDVPKFELDNKSLLCMEFLPWLATGDSPLVAFGGSDGVIRTLSMMTWKLAARCMGGHKGSISCMMTFLTSSCEALLISGGSDGLLIIWNALETHHGHGVRDLVAKLSMKAHDGGVVAIELNRVIGGSPQLITIGADKTLVIWDTNKFKELRRMKPVPKLACHSVASWRHPRAPNLDILTCVKDSYIWAIEHPTFSALTRPLCDLYSLIPPLLVATHKKLRVYCMVAHPLQPHLVATGTNVGVIVSEFDPESLPPVTPLLMSAESRNLSAVCILAKELKLLNFHLSNTTDPSLGNNSSLSETGNLKGDSLEPLHVTQTRKRINAPVPHDSYSVLSVSSSGKYVAIVWPDIPYFSIYKVSNWSIVDSGSARLLAWDTCCDRFAILESTLPPRMPIIPKGSSSRKAKEAAAAAAQAAAAAAAANSASANVQVRILLDDGTSNILMRSIGSRNEPVVGLYGGALFGIAYRTSPRNTLGSATTISTIQSMPVSGFGSYDDGFSSQRSTAEAATLNFQFFSWETCQPVGSFLPQPEWTAWDQTVEYCALAYQRYIVISTLRPQYRYLGDVAISHATGAVWQRRQLFVATPTTIECVFVDAGVAPLDIETRKRKEEMKLREAQARALAGHGELALINVDGPQAAKEEKITLRPPMLQVVRLASFQPAPSVPHFLSLPKKFKVGGDDMEERKVNEIAVGGGGVSVAVTRFPTEQKRPVGPVIVVGVRDGVLWLIDRYMTVHALSLSHPGIRCRCLAAYGDAVSAVKWAIRLAREHHDDLAQFLLGMGYANEALHLPGISKRLEFDLAMKSNDLKRALQCLLKMSNSRDMGQDNPGLDKNDILNLTAKKENLVEAVQGIVKFAKEFLDLIDAADATAQVDIAREALKRLATAGSVKGALPGHELRGLALRLANHGELTRLSGLGTNLISLGLGREAAFAAALLGDNAHMEKAWQDTGMLAEAVLHAHAHGRSTLKNLVEAWNKALQKEVDHIPTAKTDATAAFLAALELKLSSLSEAGKKPPIEIFPPGMSALSSSIVIKKNPAPATQTSQQQSNTPLAIEGPRPSGPIGAPIGAPSPSASAAVPGTPIGAPTPSAPAATHGTPVGAAPPGEAAAKQGTPIGAPSLGATAATSGMPIGAPPPGTAAATPGTPVGAPPPDTPTATPGMTIGAPPPGTPAATAGMAIGVPSPGTSAGTPGMAIGAPPPSTSVATPDMPIGATPTSAAAPAAGTPIEAPPPGTQAETSATPSRGPPTDASAATPGMATGAPPPAAKKGTTTGASPPAETSGMTTRAPTPDAPDAPDATPGKPIEAPPPGAPASRPGTPIGSPPPAALAATTGMPVGAPPTSAQAGKQSTPTEAPCPAAPDARQGSPIGAPAATPGMSIGAPAATSGTPIAASTPGAPAATPSTSIGTPPLCAPATTPSTPIGAPPPNAPAATVGKPIGAPPPGAPAAAATGAPPPISGASEPGSDDKSAISSSGNQHTTASVESNPTKSINDKPDATPTDKPLADVPSLTPDNQETSVPTTDPTSEPLA